MSKLALAILFITIILSTYMLWRNKTAKNTGIIDNKLHTCPDTPNCVSSYESNKQKWIAPFHINQSPESSIDRLTSIIRKMPRSKIIKQNQNYMHAEFRSKIFGFVDDLEFLVNKNKPIIEVRSAARVGYSDWEVNRKRIETIRNLYNQLD